MMLGKQPKFDDPRNFKLAKYLVRDELPLPPSAVDWSRPLQEWPMFRNDELGDCVCASAAHLIELWTANTRSQETLLMDSDVVTAYEAIGGYVPGKPETDNGCIMLNALKHWRTVGIGGHKIEAFAEVNPKDDWEVQTALWLFGGLHVGMALPNSARTQAVWQEEADDGGMWGGHAIGIVQSGPEAKTCITWGDKKVMTSGFFSKYCDEAYVLLSTDWVDALGFSPSGFDLQALRSDLAALT
jgi:hypothetical protein